MTNESQFSKIKVFPVDILIKSTQANLLPGLTVSCRIIVDQIDSVTFVPVDAVKTSAEGDFVFVKTATGFEQRKVETGQRNADMVIIRKGLNVNDQVALVDPFVQEIKEENSNKNQSENE